MPAEPSRGEVWFARLDPIVGHEQGGERPCLIVSDDRLNHGRATLVIVVPITRTDRGLPSHVRLEPSEGGVKEVSYAKCEDIRSISKQRLRSKLGKVSVDTIVVVEDRLRILLSL
jgi:mRNA interferase MazF